MAVEDKQFAPGRAMHFCPLAALAAGTAILRGGTLAQLNRPICLHGTARHVYLLSEGAPCLLSTSQETMDPHGRHSGSPSRWNSDNLCTRKGDLV